MKILYISAHAILEYDELTLFTELGHHCFSLGAYIDPAGHKDLPRPGVKGMHPWPDLEEVARVTPRTELTYELVDPFDVVIIMDGYYIPELLRLNWGLLKDKRVILRTIGQSLPGKEKAIRKYRDKGLKVVRYSPYEEKLKDYAGADALIRFYKDPNEWSGWMGNEVRVVNFTQTLKGRRDFCGYDFIMATAPGIPLKVYGNGNEDLGEFNGGFVPYEEQKRILKISRAYLYGGTWPASYTLSFMEAWMTGIPMVVAGDDLFRHKDHPGIKTYEIPKLIDNNENGFIVNEPNKAREILQKLLTDSSYAAQIGMAGRTKAVQLFGKETIKEQWGKFLKGL